MRKSWKKLIGLSLCSTIGLLNQEKAQAGLLIDFDHYTDGTPGYQGAVDFDSSAPLTTLYSTNLPVGVTFIGPGTPVGSGGVIASNDMGLGINALSGFNVLGFYGPGQYPGGGKPIGPEIIQFSEKINSASIMAGLPSGEAATTFVMEAYDNLDTLLDTHQVAGVDGGYVNLSVDTGQMRSISYVKLSTLSGGSTTFVFDDLSFSVPEPSSLSFLLLGGLGLVGKRNRRKPENSEK